MNLIFKGEIIEYYYKKTKTNTILFLHGWGGNKNSFAGSFCLLKNNFSLLSLTMPTTAQTKQSWCLQDYVDLVLTILKQNNINSVYIVCHSFGFRVACLLKEFLQVNKIVVTGGAGIKTFNFLKQLETTNNQLLIKQNKFKFLYSKIASKDYLALNKTNKQTFKNVVNANLINYLNFCCPMLLFWGKRDTETPLKHAKQIRKQNKSKLVLTNGNHFTYLTENAYFNNEIRNFLC